MVICSRIDTIEYSTYNNRNSMKIKVNQQMTMQAYKILKYD